jgi:hypothetical protein
LYQIRQEQGLTQHKAEDLEDPEFAVAFYDMSVDIAQLQVLENARKVLLLKTSEFLNGWFK